jgi:hypothetical protein
MMNNEGKLKQYMGRALLFLGVMLGVLVVVVVGLGVAASSPGTILTIEQIGDEKWLLGMRVIIYVVLWVIWKPLLLHFKKDLPDSTVSRSRRPLAILIAAYELLFASNLPARLIGLFI